ncbi:hypothetical protein [Corallococcus exercitus]|uniref:DUF5666 domain-containing protein n=1 Tax=Corallococcus exercitus TaxID=2316736 RepID=A0A7Y4NFT4_9BACT|nr:hypothetical protein [Corallococcus exercitus]NOK12717.1 hypothetical protein [Corallococcus exercitus]
MRRDIWLGLGIAGVASLLMCAGAPPGGMEDDAVSEEGTPPSAYQPLPTQAPTAPAAASPQQPGTQQQPGIGGSGTGTQAPAGTAPSTAPQQGTRAAPQTGGSGDAQASEPNSPNAEPNPRAEGRTTPPNPGTAPNAGTGGTGNSGTGAPAAAKPPASSASPGVAVVDAIYRGKVRSVSSKEVVIDNEGSRLPLEIGTQTRIVRDGEDIGVTQLKEGERVRATVNLVGRSHTREIAVLTGAEARRDAETQRRR